jgi:hypothetical protein
LAQTNSAVLVRLAGEIPPLHLELGKSRFHLLLLEHVLLLAPVMFRALVISGGHEVEVTLCGGRKGYAPHRRTFDLVS